MAWVFYREIDGRWFAKHREPFPIKKIDGRIATNFIYSEIIEILGRSDPQALRVREILTDLVTTVDGVITFKEVDPESVDEMDEKIQKLRERGVKPPKNWKESINFSELGFFGDASEDTGGFEVKSNE